MVLYNDRILLIFKRVHIGKKEESMGIGKIEVILLIVLVIVMLFVGGKKLPELARGVGEAFKELKKGFRDDDTKDTAKSDDVKVNKK